jgi:hypothetical protein
VKPKGLVAPVKIVDAKASKIAASCRVVCQDEDGKLWQMSATQFNAEMKPYREDYPDFRKWCEDVVVGLFYGYKDYLEIEDYKEIYFMGKPMEESYLLIAKRSESKRKKRIEQNATEYKR